MHGLRLCIRQRWNKASVRLKHHIYTADELWRIEFGVYCTLVYHHARFNRPYRRVTMEEWPIWDPNGVWISIRRRQRFKFNQRCTGLANILESSSVSTTRLSVGPSSYLDARKLTQGTERQLTPCLWTTLSTVPSCGLRMVVSIFMLSITTNT